MSEILCNQCGGDGGEYAINFDPQEHPNAWQSCYHCCETGKCETGCPRCDPAVIAAEEAAEAEAFGIELNRARAQVAEMSLELLEEDAWRHSEWASENYAETGAAPTWEDRKASAWIQARNERLDG
jgi:hypothetical protein